jgi:hypothetical protein
MHRIDTATAQKDKFGQGKNGFTRGNPQTGTPATQLDYLYCDAIQEEIANAIELAGIKLDKSKHDQLAMAIKKGNVKLSSATDSSSETEAATPLSVKKTYDLASRSNNNADNAHSRINESNSILSRITDKFHTSDTQSSILSGDKKLGFVVRNDGVAGVYSRVLNDFLWYFTKEGWINGRIKADRVGGLDQFVSDRTLPVGVPLPWPQDRPPAGWFECNGASFDVNLFPRLASVFPWGRLPDLRGEFIRGWDNARGVDPGRQILSWQEDAIRNITGTFLGLAKELTGVFGLAGIHPTRMLPAESHLSRSALEYSFDAARVVPTSHDNHPRNIAFMYIVKTE